MRERTTWNRNEIAQRAASVSKTADPYLMNQDHVKVQPAADAYVTGDPSSFGEDVHPSGGTWEAEYANGQVKRNEIGMPEMRGDTFNHSEKTASEQVIIKRASLCVEIARSLLPKNASASDIESQAFAFMAMSDADVMSTYSRIARQADEKEEEQGQAQQKQAQQDQEQQDQAQQKQAQQDQQQAQDQDQGKQAGEMPPQFKENAEKKKEEAAAKKDGDKDEDKGQDKKAALSASVIAAIQSGDLAAAQTAITAAMEAQAQAAVVAQQQPMQAQLQQMQAQLQQMAQQPQMANQQQVAQMQQQMAQMQQQFAQQQQMQGTVSNDAIIDQMLATDDAIPQQAAEMEVEMDTPQMDMGEVVLGPEDDALRALFATDDQDQAQQQEQAQQKQAAVRTASTRTVGTRPQHGVSQIGGGTAGARGGEVDKLTSLWSTSPNVKEAFGLPNDR